MSQKITLIKMLKRALKQHGLTYEDVAKELDLAHGSVKRLFSQYDFSLDRLDQICGMIGMEISDLVLMMQQAQQQTESLTREQEQELVADTRLLLTAHLLLNNWKVPDILENYAIGELEMIQYLAKLDRMKILDLLPGNRVKLKISRKFKWLKNGPIEHFYREHVQSDFFDSKFNGPGEIRIFLSGMISRSANAELMRRIERLAHAFDEIHQEDAHTPIEQKFGTSLILAMRPWEIKLFEQFRRANTDKKF